MSGDVGDTQEQQGEDSLSEDMAVTVQTTIQTTIGEVRLL